MQGIDGRVSRIVGQLKGIQKMIQDERDCVEVLQQISAVKKAINGLTAQVVLLHFRDKLPQERHPEVEKIIERSIDL